MVEQVSTGREKPSLHKGGWIRDRRSSSKTADVRIVPLPQNGRGIRRFLRFAYQIYENDPNWVAPLLLDAKELLSRKNPFFVHARLQLWLAYRDGRPVGRVAGILDEHHNRYHHDQAAFFGFFECINDPTVAQALFDTVCQWAAGLGMRRVIGPMNPNTNEVCGLLIEGFDSRPVFMMPYNPPYYADLIESAGFQKTKDLYAYWLELTPSMAQRLERIARICRRRNPRLTFRHVNRRNLRAELGLIQDVYNAAWGDNWGFVPMTHEEIEFLAKRLKPLFHEEFVWLALDGDTPVGFMLGMPDLNEAFWHLRGRLLSSGLFRALPYLLGKKHPQTGRVITLGVRAEYRNRGIESVLINEPLQIALRLGYKATEASWILEDNLAMQRVIEDLQGRLYKRYRIYERRVA